MGNLYNEKVTGLTSARKRPGWVRIVLSAGDGPVLTEARCVDLGVRAGREWTPELEAACVRGAAVDGLKERALRLLSRGPRSRTQLRERLSKADADSVHVEAALDELTRAGLIDDRAYARAVVEAGSDSGPGRRHLLERKLAMAGVEHEIIAEALRSGAPPAVDDARRLVESKLDKTPKNEPRAKTAARLARLLASRGFDEYTAREAIESVMGTIEDEDDARFTD